SGIVMLFIGYPKLTPWERLRALPALQAEHCCVPLQQALAATQSPVKEAMLTSVGKRAIYRLQLRDGRIVVIDARTGMKIDIDTPQVLASAQAFLPHATGHEVGIVNEDRWTHSRGLDPHRPLHIVQMDDADHTRLYLSSATGEVVLDAPLAQRAWNYVGAWL